MQRLLVTTICSALALAAALPAHAVYFVDGNQLLENVHSDAKQAARFYAYVSAVVDAVDGKGIPKIGCFRVPSGATVGQVADSVKHFLDDNPKFWHINASHLVATALALDYPCR